MSPTLNLDSVESREPCLGVLHLYQPWAWAVVHGLVHVANLSSDHRWRGTHLIYAKTRRTPPAEAPQLPGDANVLPTSRDLVYGALIGEVSIDDIVPMGHAQTIGRRGAVGPWVAILSHPKRRLPLACPPVTPDSNVYPGVRFSLITQACLDHLSSADHPSAILDRIANARPGQATIQRYIPRKGVGKTSDQSSLFGKGGAQ